MSLAGVADQIPNYDHSSLSRFENGAQGIKRDKLVRLAEVLGTTVSDLYRMVDEANGKQVYRCGSETSDPAKCVPIRLPLIEKIDFLGPGETLDTHVLSTDAQYELGRDIISGHVESAVFITRADSTNMDPLLPKGATVAVDTDQHEIHDGDVYLVNREGFAQFATLYRHSGSQVRVVHCNDAEYPTEIISNDEITVLGRAFWLSAHI